MPSPPSSTAPIESPLVGHGTISSPVDLSSPVREHGQCPGLVTSITDREPSVIIEDDSTNQDEEAAFTDDSSQLTTPPSDD